MLVLVQASVSTPSTKPATSAVLPSTPCTQAGRKAVVPMIRAPHSTPETLPARITGRRSRWAASIGSRARRSRIAKPARQRAPTSASPARMPPGSVSHWISAAIPVPTPAISSPAPGRSTRPPPTDAGAFRWRATNTIVAAPTGRLSQNTNGQPTVPTQSEPISGPTMAATPQTPET